ncbi:uncharacterized protein DS421_12g369350 [Arachis hypogaea]|nr:uncharacterized protein DS421_12g369350 [Arachis hypogaea]
MEGTAPSNLCLCYRIRRGQLPRGRRQAASEEERHRRASIVSEDAGCRRCRRSEIPKPRCHRQKITVAGVGSPQPLEVATGATAKPIQRPLLFRFRITCCYGYCERDWELRFWLPVISG